ncbi:MAG: hypothetical protein K8R59_11980 [Thermoanaerobaculales bacterium]|nr:hypothetical protein [Thermoanaerobaculales bacterium]
MTVVAKAHDKKPKETGQAVEPVAYGLLALAWFVPGLGHWVLGKKTRAVVFASVITAGFITGLVLGGELGVPKVENPFSWLATFAGMGNGVLYLVRLLWLNGLGGLFSGLPLGLVGGGDPVGAGFIYGKTFLITAGLMNYLAVLDVSDIARGVKE